MAVLRAAGFFRDQEIEVQGVTVRPIDVTAALLFPQWKMEEGEVDITVMQVIVEGGRGGTRQRWVYDLLDRYDAATGTHSMARTTGYTATVAARMLAAGLYERPGISPPELVGRHSECVDFMLQGLAERRVVFHEHVEEVAPDLRPAVREDGRRMPRASVTARSGTVPCRAIPRPGRRGVTGG
jgi:saccharopine dehydrogenase-like NADP-dependent oxidoreductase